MVPAVELALAAGIKVYVYFPPFHTSNSLKNTVTSHVIHLERYETRFKKCVMPDTIYLQSSNYNLSIPSKWKAYQ